MTETYELAVYNACDGKVLPTGCSGLAIVSRYPFQEVGGNILLFFFLSVVILANLSNLVVISGIVNCSVVTGTGSDGKSK
jgi:hypothetical protein